MRTNISWLAEATEQELIDFSIQLAARELRNRALRAHMQTRKLIQRSNYLKIAARLQIILERRRGAGRDSAKHERPTTSGLNPEKE